MATFNKVWTSPETLPTRDELQDPRSWLARVDGGTAAGDGAPVAGSGTTAGADGVILQLPAGVGLAVITGLADDVHISPAGDGTSVAMSWKRRSATA